MKVENHDTTKLGNQHENLLKGEIQRMWTNIKLCLTTYYIVSSFYSYCTYGVFNLCQHFEISYSRYANKHFITGVYITINDSYR